MKPGLEVLEKRECPAVVTDHGGAILAAPQIENVYIGAPANLDGFARTLVANYAPLLSSYGITSGVFLGSLSLAAPSTLSIADLQSLLAQAIASGQAPAPNANTLYMVYLSQNVTDSAVQGDAAFHNFFVLNGHPVVYSVAFPGFQEETIPASHEFAEAVTDPLLNGWYAGSPTTGEIADLYNGQSFALDGFQLSEFSLPDGSAYQAPAPPFNIFQLLTIPAEEFTALAWQFLARMDAAFSPQAADAQALLNDNPMLNSPYGWWCEAIGEAAFFQALEKWP